MKEERILVHEPLARDSDTVTLRLPLAAHTSSNLNCFSDISVTVTSGCVFTGSVQVAHAAL